MNFIDHNILTIVTFLPLAGALLLTLFPNRDRDIKWFALGITLITLLASLHLPWHFDRSQAGFQFEQNVQWISHPNIHYHLGVDGISLWLVVLTTFLLPLCVLISWKSIHGSVKEFFILMLVLETAMLGVFVALDLFLFYFFWEATLIPMALIIGMFGHGRRIYAAVKFFLYTMFGSLLMLVAILVLYFYNAKVTGTYTFDLLQLYGLNVPFHLQFWMFLAFAIAFAIKVPMFPFHTWLPDAHVEAPTPISMISTRRFFARPSGVSFGATGLVAPNAWAERRFGLTPWATRYRATLMARLADKSRLSVTPAVWSGCPIGVLSV